MSRADEHRQLKKRWVDRGFRAGWKAARRALGDKNATQDQRAAFIRYLKQVGFYDPH